MRQLHLLALFAAGVHATHRCFAAAIQLIIKMPVFLICPDETEFDSVAPLSHFSISYQ